MNVFFTFEAESAEKLNEVIGDFCCDNRYIEVSRSTPALSITQQVFVTSELREREPEEELPIEALELSDESLTFLKKSGIKTVGQILEAGDDIANIRGMNLDSYIEIMHAIR